MVISGSNDKTVRVWDLATGTPIGAPFTGHTGSCRRWRPRSSTGAPVVVSGGDDKTVRVWDLATGAPVGAPFTGHTKRLVAVTTAQLRGRTVVISGGRDDAVQVWDLAHQGAGRVAVHRPHPTSCARWPPRSRAAHGPVISGGRDNTVRVWDLDARTRQ